MNTPNQASTQALPLSLLLQLSLPSVYHGVFTRTSNNQRLWSVGDKIEGRNNNYCSITVLECFV